MNIKILSLNVGKPQQMMFENKEISSGIEKNPTDEALYLSWLNFAGDGQGDLVYHGGKEKAVCVYPYEHYPYWEKVLQRRLAYGAFGENLTTQGLLEADVCIGDIFKLGEAIVQVSQPRQPCYKLIVKYGRSDLPLEVEKTGYTGFYLRVLEEGMVSKANGFVLIEHHPKRISIAYANQIMHHEKDNFEGIQRILEVEELSINWRKTFLKRLGGGQVDTKERLTGSN